jgi:hypothetical protein
MCFEKQANALRAAAERSETPTHMSTLERSIIKKNSH